MRFLNPKTDYAFRKIFGSETSRDILISFLNAILDLSGADVIIDVAVLDPRLAPKIEGMKDTYLDVRVKDQRERSYIVEMQVLNVEGFEKRILYNACKTYVNQLGRGDPYHILTEVVAVTITDFTMFPDLTRVISRFRLRADENPLICHRDLELVFAELPKFTRAEAELTTTLDRWLYFLKTARDLTAIPESLALEPAIVHAFEIANRAGWTEAELDELEKREMWVGEQRHILELARKAEQKARKAEEKAQEAEEKAQEAVQKAEEKAEEKAREAARMGEAKGEAKGKAKGKAETLLRLLRRREKTLPAGVEDRVRAADTDQLDDWSDRLFDGGSLAELFGIDHNH